MNDERLMKVLLSPHVSEKSARIEMAQQYAFKVVVDATKLEIKKAVEKLFNVKVMAVRTINQKGKTRRFKGKMGQRKSWKKAYVRLAEGQAIKLGSQA